jgi:hypothetical protein
MTGRGWLMLMAWHGKCLLAFFIDLIMPQTAQKSSLNVPNQLLFLHSHFFGSFSVFLSILRFLCNYKILMTENLFHKLKILKKLDHLTLNRFRLALPF